ncbi:hypothetical protein H4W79_002876 [Nocardiopsis terrae]|uniref:Uncharacterized protein n=1 Tax=Nocardiopsis terrae TaxID=372655 RepID=A0ABR9HI11_9ACTN|nr:hypothetical protein [Nocardiopsis terrae]
MSSADWDCGCSSECTHGDQFEIHALTECGYRTAFSWRAM